MASSNYHVFLSFRGADTRNGFTNDLFEELKERAIRAFRDDPYLRRGTSINEELMRAIEQSRFAIVIISENYASSAWCLDELAHIVRCMKVDSGRIMPIFYGVDPGDVRRQTGSFAEHFTEHERTYGQNAENVSEWRDALTEVGNRAGWDSKVFGYDDPTLINNIADVVWNAVHPRFYVPSGSTQKLVGRKLNKIDWLLNLGANDVRVIGIWGADKICIQATAQLVHDMIYDNFDVSSVLIEVGGYSKGNGLVYLQTELLKQLNGEYIPVPDVYEGKRMTRDCVHNEKVLSILDDVDELDQIVILGGEKHWYGNGSRIIITSLNLDLLVHVINEVEPYLVEGLNEDEAQALQLYGPYR